MPDNDIKKQSQFTSFLDAQGRIPALDLDPAKVKEFWDAVNEEADKYIQKQQSNTEVLDQLFDDEKARKAALRAQEIKNQKKILQLEIEISKAKANSDKKTEKALEKRLKLVRQTQDLEKETAKAKEKYADALEEKEENRKQRKEAKEAGKQLMGYAFRSGDMKEFAQGLKLALTGGVTDNKAAMITQALDTAVKTLSNLIQKLDKSIEEIAKYKSDWDTRLFGSETSHSSLVNEIAHSVGASPYVKQADIMKNIDKAIESGISYNVSQRAFLETVKDDIARTFNAFDSTLMQIVRVQQSDSTAARLGMEATLNQFLNSMYSNTEYLNSLSDSVTGALYEATSLLSSSESIGFEYQVQKWLGSLYSVGMSQQGITSIAQALGELASGNISNIDSGAGRLLVMAASRSSNLNYSDMLTKGINDSEINELMYSMVNYLAQIANSNKVVQTQYAGIFGLNTSDIVAAGNLKKSGLADVASSGLTYAGSINALNKMAASIGSRQNMGEWLDNLMGNFQYTFASGIAENPALYGIWKIGSLLDDLVGGLPIPFVSAMGFGVDLETTVADLMRVTALSGGIMSGLGALISGLGNNANGLQGVLSALGVSSQPGQITKGSGLSASLGETMSTTSFIGNSQADVENAALASAEDQKKDLSLKASEEEEHVQLEDVDDNITRIYNLLESVIKAGKLSVQAGSDLPFSRYDAVFGGV